MKAELWIMSVSAFLSITLFCITINTVFGKKK